MHCHFHLLALTGAHLLFAGLSAVRAADDPAVAADEATVRAVGLTTDGRALLEFFRLRTKGTASPQRLATLIEQLNADTAAVREKACAELVSVGPVAVPVLRRAAKDVDAPASSALARRCLTALEKDSASVTTAAARLLALRRPDGAAEALLEFLPAAEDEHVIGEAKTALAALAYRDGKPVPALVKALEDPSSLRRAAAVEVLCQNGPAGVDDSLRKLLHDPMPSVRLKAGLALARAQDQKAVTILISLLGELPIEQARAAEDYLADLAGDTAPKVSLTDDASRAKARDAWNAWWQGHDGTNLVNEFRKRTVTEAELKKITDLVFKLGDEVFETREQAAKQLRELGQVALRPLRDAAASGDLEVRNRARDLMNEIEKDKNTPLSPVTARLIALRRPAGAAGAILGFLPFTEDHLLLDEAQAALNAVAHVDGKAEPAVLRALEDRYPMRRAAAAEALCQVATPEHQAAVRRLLNDPDAGVRLKAAFGLAGLRDKAAVPVLISLVREADAEHAAAVEDYLARLASDRGPAGLPQGFDDDARQKRSEGWAQWWTANGDKVGLPERQSLAGVPHYLGYTLLTLQQQQAVIELGTDGKERWRIGGIMNPMDARVLPGGRLLIAEMGAQRVTERGMKGEILWEKRVPTWPVSCDRLANGNTLIATQQQVLEVDRSGHEVFTYNRMLGDIMSAHKTRDGYYVLVSSQGMIVRVDHTGKEVKTVRVQGVSNYGNELLPNGNVLIPLAWQNKVTEYDPDGKVVWEATAPRPMAVCRLPNGHTLVAPQQLPAKMYELDRNGKQVAETSLPSYATRIRRR
jgi:HEAT repeat protein